MGIFGLYRRRQKSLEGVVHSLTHQSLTFALASDVVTLESVGTLGAVYVDAHTQHALVFAPSYGEKPVGRTPTERLAEVEVVTELGSLILVFLRLVDFGCNGGKASELSTHRIARALVLAYDFGYDVLGSSQCFLYADALGLPAGGDALYVALALQHDDVGQRFQSLLAGYLCPCAPLGSIGQIYVFQQGGVPAVVYAPLQFRRHCACFGDGAHDGLLALGEFLQSAIQFVDLFNLHLVHSARLLLAIAAYEWNCGALVNEREGIKHVRLSDVESLSDDI